jgi:molybdopterin-containing oxidoreductase family membrane subunit
LTTEERYIDTALSPLRRTRPRFFIFMSFILAGLGVWGYFIALSLIHGHGLQGLSNKGAVWGILIANVIDLIGISHVGIAISATVRILQLERYKPLARIAEIITLVAMATAVWNIGLDVGRLERFIFNVVLFGRWHAPFVWSMTVISAYVVGSSVYLYLAMRRDLALCMYMVPGRRWLYRILCLGYSDCEASRKMHDRVIWWCAVVILPIMVSVHSVYGYVFGIHGGRPGWFNPFQAPYFVLGAIVTGFSAIIIIISILRPVYGWGSILTPRMFKGLGIFLGFITLLYLYFFFSEMLTGLYAAPRHESSLAYDLLFGKFKWLTNGAVALGLVVPFWALFVQGVNSRIRSIPLTVASAVLIFIALWIKRYLIVVPPFYHQHMPIKIPPYVPTFEEWAIMVGSWFFGVFAFVFFIKTLPLIELPEDYPMGGARKGKRIRVVKTLRALPRRFQSASPLGSMKRWIVLGTLVLGVCLIAAGILGRDQDYAPIKWLSGIFLLCSIPLELCIIPGRDWAAEPSSLRL